MSIDSLIGLVNGLNPEELLPDLQQLLAKLAPVMQVAVLVGPAALLLLGFVYLFLAPKEANHALGFRCWWGMSSVGVWRFTQKLSGIVWLVMGLVMGGVMWHKGKSYAAMAYDQMLMDAAKAIVWQIGAVIVSILLINIALIVLFNHRGERRNFSKLKELGRSAASQEAPAVEEYPEEALPEEEYPEEAIEPEESSEETLPQ